RSRAFKTSPLDKIQMNVTVPHHQKGPALSRLRSEGSARALHLPIATDPSLRGGVTGWDSSNCQGLFFTIEPGLSKQMMMKCAQRVSVLKRAARTRWRRSAYSKL